MEQLLSMLYAFVAVFAVVACLLNQLSMTAVATAFLNHTICTHINATIGHYSGP